MSVGSSHRTVVMSNKRWSLGFAVFFGILTVAGVARELAGHNIGGLIVVLVFFGGPLAFCLWWGTHRRPLLVIDDHGLTEGRSGRRVSWDGVAMVSVGTRRGLFGESHDLVVKLAHDKGAPPERRRFVMTNANNPDELTVNLDLLSMSWNEVMSAVEQGFGQRVIRDARRR